MLYNMFNLQNPLMRSLMVCLVVVLLFAPALHQAQAAQVLPILAYIFPPIGLIVLVYDYFSCTFDLVFYSDCPSRGGTGGAGNGSGTGGAGSGNGTGGTGNGAGGAGSGGGAFTACLSALSNACGMHGTGILENGVCNATPPPNSACPLPIIGDEGFYADPPRVRAGNTTTLHWDVTDATLCSLTGGGLSLSSLGIVGSTETLEVNAATAYTLTCWNGTDGPQNSEEAIVTIVPSFEEI